jgi:CheY-like chemotaxis protein
LGKILIIDDDPISLKLCSQFLEAKHSCFVTDEVQKAKSIILLQGIDAVLSDFWMKGSNIHELLHWRNDQRVDVPIVGMSKYSGQKELREARDKGLFDFVSKPVDGKRLNEIIDLAITYGTTRVMDPSPEEKGILSKVESYADDSGPAVLNFKTLMNLFGTDTYLMQKVIRDFVQEIRNYRDLLVEMYLAETLEELHKNIIMICHHLENSALQVGAEELLQTCRDLQKTIIRGETVQMADIQVLVERMTKLEKRFHMILTTESPTLG